MADMFVERCIKLSVQDTPPRLFEVQRMICKYSVLSQSSREVREIGAVNVGNLLMTFPLDKGKWTAGSEKCERPCWAGHASACQLGFWTESQLEVAAKWVQLDTMTLSGQTNVSTCFRRNYVTVCSGTFCTSSWLRSAGKASCKFPTHSYAFEGKVDILSRKTCEQMQKETLIMFSAVVRVS